MLSPRRSFCCLYDDSTNTEKHGPLRNPKKIDRTHKLESEPICTILERHSAEITIKIKGEQVVFRDDPLVHEHLSISKESMNRIAKLPYSSSKFEETFYDTARFDLLRQNCWLRFRDNAWSLKFEVSLILSIDILYSLSIGF